jgi:hypothetical protein
VLGAWQWIFGHGIVSSRLLSVLITAVNIGLLAHLLHRLGCTLWPIAFAIVVFALTEDSIFYFSTATPYAYAVCLQLVALHLLLGMQKQAGFTIAIALGAVLTMGYLLRVNSVFFIALSLAIAWVRAGHDRWRVYFCAAAIFLATWSLLALLWGRQFIYVTLWFPSVTDRLVQAGALPKLYPLARSLSSQMLGVIPQPTMSDFLAYVFGWEIVRDWILAHHALPVAAALFASILVGVKNMPHRGWIALFAASYWAMLVLHHLGAQSFCPVCIQVYANYFNYLAALAGGLALHGLLRANPNSRLVRGVAVCAIAASIGLAAAQSWSLTGKNALPSLRNRANSLPQEVRKAGEAISTLLPRGATVELVGRDSRIALALARADIRVPPITLALAPFYRRLNDNLTPEQWAEATEELRQLTMWTDQIARQWIQDSGDWMVVQRQPVDRTNPWLLWSPEAPLIKTGLENCFEQVAEKSFADFEPPLSFALYRRTRRGGICLGE